MRHLLASIAYVGLLLSALVTASSSGRQDWKRRLSDDSDGSVASHQRRNRLHDPYQARQYNPHSPHAALAARQAGPSAVPTTTPSVTFYNGGFELASFEQWTLAGAGAVTQSPYARDGQYVYRLAAGSGSLFRTIEVTPGASFVLTFSAWIEKLPATFRVVVRSGPGRRFGKRQQSTTADTGNIAPTLTSTSGGVNWVDVQVPFTAGNTNQVTVEFDFESTGITLLDRVDAAGVNSACTGTCSATVAAGPPAVSATSEPTSTSSDPTSTSSESASTSSTSTPDTSASSTSTSDTSTSISSTPRPTPTPGPCPDGQTLDGSTCVACNSKGAVNGSQGACGAQCPAGSTASASTCVCPDNSSFVGGECKTCESQHTLPGFGGQCGLVCPATATVSGQSCKCADGSQYAASTNTCALCNATGKVNGVDGTCGLQCPTGANAVGNVCVCTAGQVWTAGINTCSCPPATSMSGGVCKPCVDQGLPNGAAAGECGVACTGGTVVVGGSCTCGVANTVLESGTCQCQIGYQLVAGNCVSCSVLGRGDNTAVGAACSTQCLDPTTILSGDSCGCPLGSSKAAGASTCSCTSVNTTLDDLVCKCKTGAQLDGSGDCVLCSTLGRGDGPLGGPCQTQCLEASHELVSGSCVCAGTKVEVEGVCKCPVGSQSDGTGGCALCSTLGRQDSIISGGACSALCVDPTQTLSGNACGCPDGSSKPAGASACSCSAINTILDEHLCKCAAGSQLDGTGSCVTCGSLGRGDGPIGGPCLTQCTEPTHEFIAGVCTCPGTKTEVGGVCLCPVGSQPDGLGDCTLCSTLLLEPSTVAGGPCSTTCAATAQLDNGICKSCASLGKVDGSVAGGACSPMCLAGFQSQGPSCISCASIGRPDGLSNGSTCGSGCILGFRERSGQCSSCASAGLKTGVVPGTCDTACLDFTAKPDGSGGCTLCSTMNRLPGTTIGSCGVCRAGSQANTANPAGNCQLCSSLQRVNSAVDGEACGTCLASAQPNSSGGCSSCSSLGLISGTSPGGTCPTTCAVTTNRLYNSDTGSCQTCATLYRQNSGLDGQCGPCLTTATKVSTSNVACRPIIQNGVFSAFGLDSATGNINFTPWTATMRTGIVTVGYSESSVRGAWMRTASNGEDYLSRAADGTICQTFPVSSPAASITISWSSTAGTYHQWSINNGQPRVAVATGAAGSLGPYTNVVPYSTGPLTGLNPAQGATFCLIGTKGANLPSVLLLFFNVAGTLNTPVPGYDFNP